MGRSLSALSLYWRLDDMREISQETQEILKSQRMLGVNKYNYELKLEGIEAYGDIIGTYLNNVMTSARLKGADAVVRNDGKLLVVYQIGASLYSKVLDSETELLSVTNCLAGGTMIYTFLDDSNSRLGFSILKLKNGKILLFINENGDYAASRKHECLVYESATGLGTDFILKTTIVSQNRTHDSDSWMRNSIGKATQLPDGSIVIGGNMGIWNYGRYDVLSITVYKSIDNGQTWVKKYGLDTSSNNMHRYGNITNVGNVLFFVANNNYSLQFYYSNDNGETWNRDTNNFKGIFGNNSWNRHEYDFIKIGDQIYNMRNPASTETYYYQLRKYIGPDSCTYSDMDNPANYQLVYAQNINSTHDSQRNLFIATPRGNILYGTEKIPTPYPFVVFGVELESYKAPLESISLDVSKGRGGANSLRISVNNTNGKMNPRNPESDLYGIIGLNKQVILKQGYGEDLIETFTGMIDSFQMKSYPHTMEISCRDHLKKALDQTITEAGSHTVSFESQPIESIFGYLCYLAGIETGEIDETGITISKEFSWQTYADAFQFLADLASFEYGADEYGKVYFKRDYQPDEIAIAYTFEEGLDITSLSYQLADNDLYYMVKVYGKSGDNVISYTAPFPDAAKYNIMPQKILKVDATEASTLAELKKIADRSIYLMNSRTAIVNFSAVAVPWLQVGDFIQVNESSSMSAGIYRISSLNLKMTDKDFLMDLQCYYYGDSIETGTLPEDTATQTGDPLLNLIPEMTSNTSPSGVARASSVLILYANDYQPWNALNSTSDDLYWNAVSQYGWIEYQFTEKTIIDKYMLKARQAIDYNKAMPKNWTFEGFDGEKWITLDTQSNQTAWGIHEERSFDFDNTTAYAKYRLNVSANNGFNRLQLEQLAMYYRGGD